MRILPPTAENIAEAGQCLRDGKLVIIPTETVYGMAANALDAEAVSRIFAAKGRPADNPLIVHIEARHDVGNLASSVPEVAERLMDAFWPGPLTLVLSKQPQIPGVTTANLDTVAVRMPANGVALRIIGAAQVPLAAPSANRFMAISPTRPEHIDAQLAQHVEILIDGGSCDVGLESTVLDCTGAEPRILRPGRVSRADIENVLGKPISGSPELDEKRSPGMYRRHYAPQTPTILALELGEKDAGLTFQIPQNSNQIQMPTDPRRFGAALYDALHRIDSMAPEQIVIQTPPSTADWEAVWDRLRKATHS